MNSFLSQDGTIEMLYYRLCLLPYLAQRSVMVRMVRVKKVIFFVYQIVHGDFFFFLIINMIK